jgi:aspartyl-tRNA synthetase
MDRYGVDRPDTRVLLELVELTDVFAASEFRAFRSAVDGGGIVKCLPVHDAGEITRGQIDKLEAFVKKELGGKGLAWVRVEDGGGWQSPIAKFLSDAERSEITRAHRRAPGSVLFFQADEARAPTRSSRGCASTSAAARRVDGRAHDVLFVIDFPLFERDDKGALTYVHQPFVAPLDEDLPLLESDPSAGARHALRRGDERRRARLGQPAQPPRRRAAQDLRADGLCEERDRAALRLHARGARVGRAAARRLRVRLRPLGDGARGAPSLRDVIAFPKTQRGQDLLMDAPSPVATEQLDELAIRVSPPETS